MIYFIFISLAIGIATFKIAEKLQWEERLIRKRKERKVKWDKKQKEKSHGKRTRRSNKPAKRKKK